MSKDKNCIIFYDGLCGLCHGLITFLIPRDKKNLFLYSAIQGETAKSYLPFEVIEKLETVAYFKDGKLFYHSDAALEIITDLGGPYSLLKIFKLIPRFLRDPAYGFISKHRYKFFGKKEQCLFVSPKKAEAFLP